MPWHIPEDLHHFKRVTDGSAVLMGRRTWDSLPERFRPLPGRENIVITRDETWAAPGAIVARSLDDAIAQYPDAWVMGGAQIYEASMSHATELVVTELDINVPGDAYAPTIDRSWRVEATDPATGWHTSRDGVPFRWVWYFRS